MSIFGYFYSKIWPRKLRNCQNIYNICTNCIQIRLLNYSAIEYDREHNPSPIFFNKGVQTLLTDLTRVDFAKVFRKKKLGDKKLEDPVYKFMTDEELQKAFKEAEEKSKELLQMPPVVPVCMPIEHILSEDPALQGLETCRLIFTDITFGVKNSERLIVVREPDGILRKADWDTRNRMNEIYFPSKGRSLKTPRIFEDRYFEDLLKRNAYEFILDAACIQFEPNDREYQRIVSITYQHVNENRGFDLLRSTRHFGTLTFFLVWNKIIDNLLLELIETTYIEEAYKLIQLYFKVHNIALEGNDEQLLNEYVKNYTNKKSALELAVQAYKDLAAERERLRRGIKTAHGLI